MNEDGTGGTLHSVFDEVGLASLLGADEESDDACECDAEFDEDELVVDADDCDGGGELASEPDCRRTVVDALSERDAAEVVVRTNGVERRYEDAGADLLTAAGRFVDLLGEADEQLAETARRDPLAAAERVTDRIDRVGDVGAESGLSAIANRDGEYGDLLAPTVGLSITYYYLDPTIDDEATLVDVRSLETGSTARIYDRPDSVPLYALDAVDLALSDEEHRLLLEGYEAIAEGVVDGDRAASRAIEHVSDEPVEPTLSRVLAKHTSGYGILEDLFGDPRVSDVYATSPVSNNPLRVVVDGESMATNLHLTPLGAEALGSRVRRTSGRSFSRAQPTVDATATLGTGVDVRIAGVTDPVADGVAFAFREQADDSFTLPALVANDTMTAEVAAFLSVAVERNAAALIAGSRGAGKTTLLGTLLYELTADTRTVVIEDTPELPVDPLQSVDRDVQALRTGTGDGPEITTADALRTALRLGDGALVVGEIRGEEAQVLYEAMRVGANANAVLGTIHGDGAEDVYERVVTDLDVEPSSFVATDLVVTVQAHETPDGRVRRLARIEEVMGSGDDVWFEPLYAFDGDEAVSTGRIERGESRVVNRLAGPAGEYADVREQIEARKRRMRALSGDGRTAPREVAATYAGRGE